MVPAGSSVMLELVLAVHSYHVIAYPVSVFALSNVKFSAMQNSNWKSKISKVKSVWFSIFAFRFSFFVFRHSLWDRISNFDIQNSILAFALSRNILFWHSKSYFDIRTESEYAILTFKILYWNSHWGRKSYFDIQNPILTFAMKRKILFWNSESYFDVRIELENPILTYKILFCHSHCVGKS